MSHAIGFTNSHLDPDAYYGADLPTCPHCDGPDAVGHECPQPPPPLPGSAARIARAFLPVLMRQAHANARSRVTNARPRRCSLAVLCRQAVSLAAVMDAAGCRFDVVQKAADAYAFSAGCDLAALAVPSKLVSVASYQDAAHLVGERLAVSRGWVTAEHDGRGNVFAIGLRLGRVQDKHTRWMETLAHVRIAITDITGGHPYTDRHGEIHRGYYGVNVAFGVGDALGAPPAAPVETAAQMQARLANLF